MANPEVQTLVKAIRKTHGWTQEALARELGVSFPSVNNWETGKRKPHPFLLKRLEELSKKKKS